MGASRGKGRGGSVANRWKFLSTISIPDSTDPTITYLRRFRIVQTPWFGVYLHHIYLPDDDRAPHDHPWGFATMILRGGYTELVHHRPEVGRPLPNPSILTWTRGSFHRFPRRAAHRITSILPGTISLVFVGRKTRDWGFWTPEGSWVRWTDWPSVRDWVNAGGKVESSV